MLKFYAQRHFNSICPDTDQIIEVKTDNCEVCVPFFVRHGLSEWKDRMNAAYNKIDKAHAASFQFINGSEGELARAGILRVFELFCWQGKMNSSSVFLDLGSGLGKPSYLAAMVGVAESYGVEISGSLVKYARESLEVVGQKDVKIIQADICKWIYTTKAKMLNLTHVYAFSTAYNKKTRAAIFAYLRGRVGVFFATFMRPRTVSQELDVTVFGFVEQPQLKASTSKYNCYLYKIEG